MADIHRCFQLVGNGHRKFWTVQVKDRFYFATFGRIDSAGQTQTKEFESPYEASKYANKMIQEKRGKGYTEVSVGDHPGAPPALIGPTRAGQEARAAAPAQPAKSAATTEIKEPTRGIDL